MTMDDALAAIEAYLDKYQQEHADFSPLETRVRASGDDPNAIKIWFNFPDGTADPDTLKRVPIEALEAAHPELADFTLEVRADVGA